MKTIHLISCVILFSAAARAALEKSQLPEEFVDRFESFLRDPTEAIPTEISANINEYVDKVLENVASLMIGKNLDPMGLPEVHQNFSETILFITYHGELDLTEGHLDGLASMHRNADAFVEYDPATKKLFIDFPLGFNIFEFNYHYNAKIMGLGPSGKVIAKAKDIRIDVQIEVDLQTFQTNLKKFDIINTGHLTVDFTGNVLIDWLLDLLSNVTTTIFKKLILDIIEDVIRGGIEFGVQVINDFINDILNPTTTGAPTELPTTELPLFFKKLNYHL